MFNLQFWDIETNLLFGKVRGPCDALIGMAKLVISSYENNAGCFHDTIPTDASGNFRLFYPAQPYVIEMVSIEPHNPTILQYFSVDTVDLTWGEARKNYTYRNPPIIKISGWPDFGGGNYDVPIMEQGFNYRLSIEVLDVWGGDTCEIDTGTITIYDGIADKASDPVTLELDNGQAFYNCIPRWPNILGGGNYPYQKLFQVDAHVGEEIVTKEQWALVTGLKARTQRFYTSSPEFVWWVLHDPPGR